MNVNLKRALSRIGSLSEKDWNTFCTISHEIHLEKNEFLLKAGDVCKGIYFISSGSLRTYYLRDGKEVNSSFNFKGEFVQELESLKTGNPSSKFIELMEPSEVVFIDKYKLKELYMVSSAFQDLGRRILEQIAITEQKYASLFTLYSPKERYLYILRNHPELIQRVPLKYLASYLGVARETLSRIRRRVS